MRPRLAVFTGCVNRTQILTIARQALQSDSSQACFLNLSFEKVCWPHTLVFYLCPQSSEARGLVIKDGFLFVCFISGLFPLTSGPLVCHLLFACVYTVNMQIPQQMGRKTLGRAFCSGAHEYP